MKKIEFVKHNQWITLRVVDAFLVDGYRVFVDKENGISSTWIDIDGKSERIFPTVEAAENAILTYVKRLVECGIINGYFLTELIDG